MLLVLVLCINNHQAFNIIFCFTLCQWLFCGIFEGLFWGIWVFNLCNLILKTLLRLYSVASTLIILAQLVCFIFTWYYYIYIYIYILYIYNWQHDLRISQYFIMSQILHRNKKLDIDLLFTNEKNFVFTNSTKLFYWLTKKTRKFRKDYC